MIAARHALLAFDCGDAAGPPGEGRAEQTPLGSRGRGGAKARWQGEGRAQEKRRSGAQGGSKKRAGARVCPRARKEEQTTVQVSSKLRSTAEMIVTTGRLPSNAAAAV
eukprot:CAMPEP_0176225340 /NCGR_PEP_ID=MMETSP0121_2-20121125/21711_1 /TAXON_ID=160619 /ORGANISM="Kryptoperidinium foliaceum, Strain CCMP 1326" /LENGTH=107 /DNA_ID=CAMNT_0017564605 /DNA_START=20 /DNA_END=343 /DNA_ORIENTATION=+